MSATTHPGAAHKVDPARARRLGRARARRNGIVVVLCYAATGIGLLFLASILFTLVWNGASSISLDIFTHDMGGLGDDAGLRNAIVGSLIQTAIGTIVGTPIGLLAGTYLAEYAGRSALGNAVRFVSDMLLSAPSILVGLFVYSAIVPRLTGYSALAGGLALAVLVIPIVVRTTEDMLRLIPVQMREATMALGAPRWKMILLVCYRAARDGIVTGILLAVARIAGETAPLLFTSLGNTNFTLALVQQPMASLPLAINTAASNAEPRVVQLAWVGALLITAAVLATNIIARLALRPRK
jgi:phosphate transport system permease protein